MIDTSNLQFLWASVLVETLVQLGLTEAVICPGSRSAPLAFAFARHGQIKARSVLDERSAAFLALGLGQKSHQAVALVCTSGTAAANFLPALIEARESQVPLLVLTADRPAPLRHCNSGQTIDQQKLYGAYPNWYAELASPSLEDLAYLRQTLVYAWQRTQAPDPGPVHLNVPFGEPLAPLKAPEPLATALQVWGQRFDPEQFFSLPAALGAPATPVPLPQEWAGEAQGVILAGPESPACPQAYAAAVAQLALALGWPVLAEGLSPLRNYASLNPHLVSTYDLVLRDPQLAARLTPRLVVRLGAMPTSKVLRDWLGRAHPHQWVLRPGHRNLDPLHSLTRHLSWGVEDLELTGVSAPLSPYAATWLAAEAAAGHLLDQTLTELIWPFAGKAAWLLSQTLPVHTPVFIANSNSIREVERFWRPNSRELVPFFNRGANGIDGILSTALGATSGQAGILLTGDLALLHDTNGFLLRPTHQGHLTIVLINNQGGGIFETLPIAQFDPPFEEFFATPQDLDFQRLCATYQAEYEQIYTWDQLRRRLNPLPQAGIRVLELKTDRRRDAQWSRETLASLAAQVAVALSNL